MKLLAKNDCSFKSTKVTSCDTVMYQTLRRWGDILISFILLAITFPVILITAATIKLESPGPVFYRQERLGKKGKKFSVIKFRSMRVDAEKDGPQWAQKSDPRVTEVGKFIRKTRIDEIPQLLNVIRGDMSIIGPRPERECFTKEFSKDIPQFLERLTVKPGLTGWAQVNGGYDITPKQKFELDMYYIRHQSPALDMKIMLKTVKVVLTGEGAR